MNLYYLGRDLVTMADKGRSKCYEIFKGKCPINLFGFEMNSVAFETLVMAKKISAIEINIYFATITNYHVATLF